MSMELDHSFTVPVPPDRAWHVLLDVERIAPCMPGATVEEFDGEVVTGRIKVKVGPVSLTYRGTAKFTERDPETRMVVVDASGKETRGAGTASAAVRATLEPSGDGTQVLIHTTMNVTGRPAQFGRGVIAEVGGKLLEKFAANLAQMISDDGHAGPDSAGGTAGDGTAADSTVGGGSVADGAAVASGQDTADRASAIRANAEGNGTGTVGGTGTGGGATATPQTGPGSTQPVAVLRPASSATAAPPASHSEDSINLVRLVGPAILKRVLPVAGAAAVLVLLGRRLGKRLRHGRDS